VVIGRCDERLVPLEPPSVLENPERPRGWMLPFKLPLCGVGGGDAASLFRSLRVIGGRECESNTASIRELER
jgi:hypothetical protein